MNTSMDESERDRLLRLDDAELSRECTLDFHKGSGNGGQKVNKTSSAVRVTHKGSGISAECAESRSQTENRHLALRKLRLELAYRIRGTGDTQPDMSAPPSERNPLYALWVAKVFDVLKKQGWDVKQSGFALGVSRSKLTRLLERDAAVYREYRTQSGTDKPGKPVNVCAAVICRGDFVLITGRPKHKDAGGYFEFPGGKIEHGESREECLTREIIEELGAEIKVDTLLCEMEHRYPEKLVRVYFYRAELAADSPEPEGREGQELRWVKPETLEEQNLLPADLEVGRDFARNPEKLRKKAFRTQ